MLTVLAAMFGDASPAWPNRVPPRLAVQGDNDDDKPWRAFTASHKLKGRGRNGKGLLEKMIMSTWGTYHVSVKINIFLPDQVCRCFPKRCESRFYQ